MSKSAIINFPFTYLRRTAKQKYFLYVYIPVEEGYEIKFQDYIPAPDQNAKSAIQNRIHFIHCHLLPSETKAKRKKAYFKCYPIIRKTANDDESIEIRVRISEGNEGYIWFNKSVIFFADADESILETPLEKNQHEDLAIDAPYTFIGKPKDFFSRNREELPDFVLHLLIPLDKRHAFRKTLMTKEGRKSWSINNENGEIEVIELKDNAFKEQSDQDQGIRRLSVNTRRCIIDKPNTPDRGSASNNTNTFFRVK